jgi:hypothetical protein
MIRVLVFRKFPTPQSYASDIFLSTALETGKRVYITISEPNLFVGYGEVYLKDPADQDNPV